MVASDSHLEKWIRVPVRRPEARIRLLCFPYGGGGPGIFRKWPDFLPDWVEACAVHLPGREARLPEPAFRRLDRLVTGAREALAHLLDRPFALFGHSMGALIAFELTRLLRTEGRPLPVHLFVSALPAPHRPWTWAPIHHLPDDEFLARVRELAGTPDQVLAHPELIRLLTPTLRADFEVCETYVHRQEPPLPCPITAFAGTDDREADVASVEAWRAQTTASFAMRVFPGGHFFFHSETRGITGTIAEALEDEAGGR